MNACQPTSFSQEAFGYGSHAIIVLNATRRRHVNKQGNENNECEIPTVTLKLLIRIKTTKYTSIRKYGESHSWEFHIRCFQFLVYLEGGVEHCCGVAAVCRRNHFLSTNRF